MSLYSSQPDLWRQVITSTTPGLNKEDCVGTSKLSLRHYEKELIAALLKRAPHSLLTLTEKAHGNEFLSDEVRKQLESLDPSVPYSLMCRYLLLHVHKNLDSQGKIMHWLELLSTVLSLVQVRQQYDGESVVFKELEVPALTEVLASHSNKWEVIAISLGLPDNKIKNIAAKNVSKPVGVSLNEVLLSWVRGEFEHAKPPTMGSLQKALRSDLVGLGALANKMKLDASQGVKYSQIEDTPEEFRIVDQTKHVDVTEDNYALLEVQINGNYEANYQWTHSDFKSEISDAILCILADDISSDGYYKCEVTSTDKYRLCKQLSLITLTVHTPIDQYQSFLVDRYTRSPVIQSEWPPTSTNSFINLALIKQDSIHEAGKYGRCTIRGDMDDIFKDKESITYDEALGGLSNRSCLLIEGRPGSGKTTLLHKFSQDWARKQITVTHVRLLFFIHLRGFCSDPNIGLHDLIGCYFSGSDVDVIEKYANKQNGLGLCFVLDGLDEYMPQGKNAYIYELIRKHVLPRSVVIVASRPAAAADFRKRATRQIEVLGFLTDQIYHYMENYHFSSPSKSHNGLRRYLDGHPNVLHMCYLPIHTCMVCFLYDILESDLPRTETSIYAEFTKFTMLRMLYRDDSNSDMCIESLNDLPEPQNQLYVTICKLAFEMTKSSKQVMSQTEIKHFSLQLTDKDCMGLITVDKMAMMSGFQKLYTFLHLTFQEFLAAFYITSLDEEKQLELIEQFGDATQMKQVWKFYCGLVPINSTNSTAIRLIDQSCHGTPFKVQCSFESQQPCTCDSVVDNNSLMFKNHFFTSTDLTAIAFVISNAQHQCVMKLVFDKCTIGMEGVEILAKKTCGKLSLITILCYHGYDCVTEQLSVVNMLFHSLPCLEILDVSNTNLGPAEVYALTGSLNHPNLQIVKVGSRGNPLYSSPDLALLLAKRFSLGCSKLVNVCFSGYNAHKVWLPESLPFPFYCNIPHLNMCFKLRPIELQVLLDDLHNCTELYLTGCGIDDNTASLLADGLKNCTDLEILDLSCNIIGDKGAIYLANSVKCCLKLGRLNLSLNRIGHVGAMAVASATKCLVYLCCNYITNTNDILQHVSGHNVDFHTLTFTIGDSGVESLVHFIEESCLIDSKALCELSTNTVQCYSSVHVLDISSNNISCHGAVALSSCLKYFPHLEELYISSNNIEAQGAIAIASSLSSHLIKLRIRNSRISSSDSWTEAIKHCVNFDILSLNLMNDEGTIALAEALKHHKKLCTLNISHNNIGSDGANAIAVALSHCSHLEELIVSHNNLMEEGACSIARSIFNYAQYLYKLDISYNNIGSKGCSALTKALQQCINLHELYIACNSFNDDDATALADTLKNCALRKLDISHNRIKRDGANAIAAALSHCSHLEELNISYNSISGDGACVLARSFCYFAQYLRKLDISYNNIGSGDISAALSHCSHLEELNISYNSISGDGACVLTRSFCYFAQHLRKLDISYNNIGSDAIAVALSHCSRLEELNISYNSISGDGACVLANPFCHFAQHLRKLDISHNNIGSDGANAIAVALSHCSHLEELIVSHNNLMEEGACSIASSIFNYAQYLYKLDISYNNIGSKGCSALTKALQQCINLHELYIACNSFNDDDATALADTLKNCALRKLDISHNRDGANAIAAALSHCSHLEELNISYNSISGDGACVLARSFCYFAQYLRKLDISYNNIGSDAIAVALSHCSRLEELNISYNSISGDGACVLANSFCHFAQHLRKLDISHNNIGSDGAYAIAVALSHCSHLEELIVSHNNLMEEGACSIASSIFNYAQYLYKLDISYNNIGSMHMGYKTFYCSENEIFTCHSIFAFQNCVNLSELNISSNSINDADVIILADALKDCHDLQKLDISHNNITSDSAKTIGVTLNHYPRLEELNISYNHIGENGAFVLANTFSQFAHCLHKLDISYNYIGLKGCEAIGKTLLQCVNLRELYMSYNHLDGVMFAKSLKHYTNLRKLEISHNRINNDGANAIGIALKNCTRLEEIIVNCNHIGDKGASSIASSFCHYAQCLRKLDISRNSIGSEGCIAIATSLKHCINLEELDLSSNHIMDNGAIVLARALKHCTHLCQLDLSYNLTRMDCYYLVSYLLNNCKSLTLKM